jgi:hypothetical protein
LLLGVPMAGALFSCGLISGLDQYSASDCVADCDGGADSSLIFSRDSALRDTNGNATGSEATAVDGLGDEPAAEGGTEGGEAGPEAGDAGDESDAQPPVDSGATDTGPPPVDSGGDSDSAPPDAGIGGGPSCGPAGTSVRCNANQVCCANLPAQTNSCAAPASCAANATLTCSTASDCSGSTPICCAQLSLAPDAQNDPPPKCTATRLSTSCAATCYDTPPSNALSCTYGPAAIRLCNHDADCTLDTANPQCYNFNNAPISWCASTLAGAAGGTHRP